MAKCIRNLVGNESAHDLIFFAQYLSRNHDRELPLHVPLLPLHPRRRRRPHASPLLRQVRHRHRQRPQVGPARQEGAHQARHRRRGQRRQLSDRGEKIEENLTKYLSIQEENFKTHSML